MLFYKLAVPSWFHSELIKKPAFHLIRYNTAVIVQILKILVRGSILPIKWPKQQFFEVYVSLSLKMNHAVTTEWILTKL